MSVRVLLALVFAVVLLAAVLPAVQDAGDARTGTAVSRALDSIDEAATAVVSTGEPPPAGAPGARRTVAVALPSATALRFDDGSRVLRSFVRERRSRSVVLPAPVHLRNDTLRVTGRVALTLTYERRGGRPVLVITRGFMRESAAKKAHGFTTGTDRPPAGRHRFGHGLPVRA